MRLQHPFFEPVVLERDDESVGFPGYHARRVDVLRRDPEVADGNESGVGGLVEGGEEVFWHRDFRQRHLSGNRSQRVRIFDYG